MNKVRTLLAASAILAMAASFGGAAGQAQSSSADLILRGGTIYAGDSAPFKGDVAITGGTISYVGPRAPGTAKRVIDARGLIVAPGFIDAHTHADGALNSTDPAARLVLPFLTQGVTTAFIGVDGGGSPDFDKTFATSFGGGGRSLRDFGINFASYVGLGAVHSQVVGLDDRAPSDDEMQRMEALVDNAMCKGALGLSTGLFYAPQSFVKRDEVVALAKVAAARGGVYDSHIRDESSYTIGLKGAIAEAISIGRDAKLPAHIAHIKALGVDVHGQAPEVIAMINQARAEGVVVNADQYPWAASSTGLSAALIPRWVQDGGRDAMLQRFADAATLARMKPEIADNLRRRGGADSLLISSGPPGFEGKRLSAIASARNEDPVDTAIALLKMQEIGVVSFNQDESDIAAFMQQPWVVTSSDASLGHPRYYATFAEKYAKYVKEKKVIDLATFIRQSTVATAKMFGLEGRGELKAGAHADVIAFDPARFAPRADFLHPMLFSTGMRYVVVNGGLAIDEGEPTGVAAGQPIRHAPLGAGCN